MAIKELSKYYSDDQVKTATIYYDMTENLYRVSVLGDTGTGFVALFPTEDDAEIFAEEWVRG
jgi:hypothetical protein